MNQQCRHPDEFGHFGQRLLVFFGIVKVIEIHPRQIGKIAQNLAGLLGEFGLRHAEHAEGEEESPHPVIERSRALRQRTVVIRQQRVETQIRIAYPVSSRGRQIAQTFADLGEPRIGGLRSGQELQKPGVQRIRIATAEETA